MSCIITTYINDFFRGLQLQNICTNRQQFISQELRI